MTDHLSLALSQGDLFSSLLAPSLLSQILFRTGYSIFVGVWMSAFSASGGMPSGPAALFDFNVVMALLISCLEGGPVSI
jgi:hypothetical protein